MFALILLRQHLNRAKVDFAFKKCTADTALYVRDTLLTLFINETDRSARKQLVHAMGMYASHFNQDLIW